MGHIFCINVVSGDLTAQVDVTRESALASASPGARHVQSGESLERRSRREAMRHVIRINVETYNRSEQVDAETDRALGCPGSRARSVILGDGAERTAA